MSDSSACPKCGEHAGRLDGQTRTLMTINSWRDADGTMHTHDNNRVTQGIICACGHRYAYVVLNTCRCGWVQGAKA